MDTDQTWHPCTTPEGETYKILSDCTCKEVQLHRTHETVQRCAERSEQTRKAIHQKISRNTLDYTYAVVEGNRQALVRLNKEARVYFKWEWANRVRYEKGALVPRIEFAKAFDLHHNTIRLRTRTRPITLTREHLEEYGRRMTCIVVDSNVRDFCESYDVKLLYSDEPDTPRTIYSRRHPETPYPDPSDK